MKQLMMATIAAAVFGLFAIPAYSQTQNCSQGEHYDAQQKKCVKHGE